MVYLFHKRAVRANKFVFSSIIFVSFKTTLKTGKYLKSYKRPISKITDTVNLIILDSLLVVIKQMLCFNFKVAYLKIH